MTPDDRRDCSLWQSFSSTNGEIRAAVLRMETLNIWAPRLVFLLVWGLPLKMGLLGRGVAYAVLGAIVMGIVATLCARQLEVLVLHPYSVARYRRMAARLAIQAAGLAVPCSLLQSWWANVPGALAIANDGYAVLIDRSSDYEALHLHPANIVGVSVEWGVASMRHTSKTATVELRYQTGRNGKVQTTVIPFETDRRGADALRNALAGLRAAGASAG